MIRKADFDDISGILDLCDLFFLDSLNRFGFSYVRSDLSKTVARLISSGVFIVAVKDGEIIGCVAGSVLPSIFDNGQMFGQEAIWYVKQEHRGGVIAMRMLKAFEDAMREDGADRILMVHMDDESAAIASKIYKRQGYIEMETHYIKGL